MTQDDFDNKVLEIANSFGDNPGITYSLLPTNPTQGNCNTSTSTILLNSGISRDDIQSVKKQIPGISWGFSPIYRPLTITQQEEAVKTQNIVKWREELIH
ncbi:hypothetical protein [uncultured Muribaculum sp.]|uniref:hypothetical protein n=1 Tax=uncultured Muribaculum sp. TaxID=1918613 RepID=UPI0025D4B946|nr:hypothetical protein [uncultured Muribaculum sp.]